ncbi:MAG TPA: hypothetical protein VFE72_07765 [Lysobacter sp.]|nr:hypothetical protein [Lysobacter sp.]
MRRFPIIAALVMALPVAAQAQTTAPSAPDAPTAPTVDASATAPAAAKPKSQNRFGQAIAELTRAAREQHAAEQAASTPGDASASAPAPAPRAATAALTAKGDR